MWFLSELYKAYLICHLPLVPSRNGTVVQTAEANLLTFSRQKLALLQCEYDPKRCSHCKEPATSKKLKACSKCLTAQYCSKECQIKDWETKHKVHCKEIRRMKDVIEKEETAPIILHAAPIGQPWLLESNNEFYKIVFLENKVFMLPGYMDITNRRPFYMYNATTGQKEGTVCHIRSNSVSSICAVKVNTH